MTNPPSSTTPTDPIAPAAPSQVANDDSHTAASDSFGISMKDPMVVLVLFFFSIFHFA